MIASKEWSNPVTNGLKWREWQSDIWKFDIIANQIAIWSYQRSWLASFWMRKLSKHGKLSRVHKCILWIGSTTRRSDPNLYSVGTGVQLLLLRQGTLFANRRRRLEHQVLSRQCNHGVWRIHGQRGLNDRGDWQSANKTISDFLTVSEHTELSVVPSIVTVGKLSARSEVNS